MQGDSMEARYYLEWLPEPVRAEAVEKELKRFAALSAKVVSAAEEAARLGISDPGAWSACVLPYVPIINNFVETCRNFSPTDVVPLVHALIGVVCATSHDLEVQARVAECASKILHQHRKLLSKPLHHEAPATGAAPHDADGSPAWEPPLLVLPWRPLFDLMISLYGNPAPQLEGVGLSTTRHNTLTTLVSRCRRYFEANAAVEIWQLLRPAIQAVSHAHSEAYDALGWMGLFTPTNNINRCGPQVANQLLSEWIAAWGLLVNSPSWNCLWAGLLARMAKHDWKGQLVWSSDQLDVLFTHIIGAFDVPVGSAGSAPATQRPPPTRIIVLFGTQVVGLSSHFARVVVHLLKASPQRPASVARAAGVGTRLRQLAALMDNYMHPSNTGRWSKDLASWLSRMVEEFMHQLGKQGPKPPPWTASLSKESQDLFVDIATSLASRAQFSKDDGLSRAAVAALTALAYVQPSKVLPLVVSRFHAALDSATATHQLSAAIVCLGRCVRPMLISGWGLEEETGPQLLAEALVALLPGLDANDETKTLAVMQFFVAVMSTAPGIGTESELEGENLPEDAVRVPVYVEEWADDVVTRIITLLTNLDSGPGHRADAAATRGNGGLSGQSGGGSFLLGSASLFCNLIELLATRLPAPVSKSVAKRIAEFSASDTLLGVEVAVSAMLSQVAATHPDVITSEFIRPTLTRVHEELKHGAGGSGMHEISPTLEATICYQVNLLQSAMWQLPQAQALSLAPLITPVVDLCFQIASRSTHDAGANLLRALCHMCVEIQMRSPQAVMAPLGPEGALLLEWVERTGQSVAPLRWVEAPAEGVALAESLMQTYLLQSATRLRQLLGLEATPAGGSDVVMAASSAPASRFPVHAELVKMKGVLSGLLSHLEDFKVSDNGVQGATPLYLAGNLLPVVAKGAGVRETLAAQLAEVGNALFSMNDPEALGEFLVSAELLLCVGSLDYSDSRSAQAQTQKRSAMLSEPAAAGILVAANLGGDPLEAAASRPWRKRSTQLSTIAYTYYALHWRNSQAAFRGWATTAMPQVTHLSQLHPAFCALLHSVAMMTIHPLRQVRAEAVTVFSPVLTRFGFLARHLLPLFLSALADVPAPPELGLLPGIGAASGSLDAVALAFQQRLLAAAFRDATPPPGLVLEALAAGSGGATDTQGVRDARVEGAVQALVHCLPFWRLMFRDPEAHQSLFYTLMATRTHNSTTAQTTLASLFINVLSRYLRPPTLQHSSPEFTQLAGIMLHLARPDTLRSSWRYSLTANVLCLVLQPPPSAGAVALPFASHLMSLLTPGGMLQLGKLAISGLTLTLARLVEFGEGNPQLVADVSTWLSAPGTGTALASLLASNHSTLDASEAEQDKRGGNMAGLLNSTHEELMMRILAASLDRLTRWPEGGNPAWQPEGVRQGLFVVSHAQLVRLLATIAPEQTAAALRPVLEKAEAITANQKVETTSDKAEQATAAECTGGLLAAGVPFAAAAGTGAGDAWLQELTSRQLIGCTLELSESWAVVLRFGVSGLLEVAHPNLSLYEHIAKALGAPQPTPLHLLSAQQAQQGLGVVLDLARSSGPEAMYLTYADSLMRATLPAAGAVVAAAPAAATAIAVTSALAAPPLVVAAGGQVAVLKRLRYNHQVTRELVGCRPSATTPSQVLEFWLALTNELRQVLDVDTFSVRQQLSKTLALLIMQLGSHSRCEDATAAPPPVDADVEMVAEPTVQALGDDGTPCDLGAVRKAVARLERAFLAAFVDGSAVVQAIKLSNAGDAAAGAKGAASEPGGNGGSHFSGSESDVVMVDRPRSPLPLADDESFKGTPLASGPSTPTGKFKGTWQI